jgi:hypothetical protein
MILEARPRRNLHRRLLPRRRRMIEGVTKGWLVALGGMLLISVADVVAQEPAAPELRPLERYRGSWTYDGEDKLLGGKVTCKVLRRWISGGYFLESHRTCETPRGTRDQVEIYGFDFKAHEYTYFGFTGRVVHTYHTASIEGASVKWVGTDASRGNRCTDTFEPDHRSSTERCETAAAAGTFELRSEGRFKRAE